MKRNIISVQSLSGDVSSLIGIIPQMAYIDRHRRGWSTYMGRPTVIPCEAITAQRPPIDVEKEAEPWKPYYNPDDRELVNKPFLDRPSHICTVFERICTITEILGSVIISLYNPQFCNPLI